VNWRCASIELTEAQTFISPTSQRTGKGSPWRPEPRNHLPSIQSERISAIGGEDFINGRDPTHLPQKRWNPLGHSSSSDQ
jgi:hypothetical protein